VAEGRGVVLGIHTYKDVHYREQILYRKRSIENTGWSAYIRTNAHSGIPTHIHRQAATPTRQKGHSKVERYCTPRNCMRTAYVIVIRVWGLGLRGLG